MLMMMSRQKEQMRADGKKLMREESDEVINYRDADRGSVFCFRVFRGATLEARVRRSQVHSQRYGVCPVPQRVAASQASVAVGWW
jgi:hypothetical protein